MVSVVEPAPPGRPRDTSIEDRVTLAAVELFGERGWAGFTLGQVAARAGVGKAALYLRWDSKERLLADTLARRVGVIEAVDTGSIRGDLVALAVQLLDLYFGAAGRAVVRLEIDTLEDGGLHDVVRGLRRSQIRAARAVVERAVQRGELPPGTPVEVLLNAVCGGAINHVLTTPHRQREAAAREAPVFAEALVDLVLR
jgi:AcrR family transcriptional regulator